MSDTWQGGNPYETFMGRWSTLVAQKFLAWMDVPAEKQWLDVGCGTGTLAKLIMDNYEPSGIIGVDSSREFVAHAQQRITNPSVRFMVGLAQSLDLETDSIDALVSGLVLNFVPEPEKAMAEMLRVTKPGGRIGIFLWDYADGMQMLRTFWDAAVELEPSAKVMDEGVRFPLCEEGRLESFVKVSGLREVEASPIKAETHFQSFDDYWNPFLGGIGPAGTYAMSLDQNDRNRLEEKLRESLPVNEDGSISLVAQAWAIKGIV
ncbi:MAG TPA: SAM-dependent methyltransferase [Anaerolineae bacterium]|nr:SAM-dependent methyltransferase [Anaerolineae bacterium]